jgi:hypothetical protein
MDIHGVGLAPCTRRDSQQAERRCRCDRRRKMQAHNLCREEMQCRTRNAIDAPRSLHAPSLSEQVYDDRDQKQGQSTRIPIQKFAIDRFTDPAPAPDTSANKRRAS